jgi:SAM-dependent methyltransferase
MRFAGGLGVTQIEQRFIGHLHEMAQTRDVKVLELGTLRWESDRPTHHAEWLPANAEHVMSDVAAGQDVDVVADAHDLEPFKTAWFDAVIAVSVWEHLSRPWIAAEALSRVLKPGGIAYIATHQTFPIHGYPSDFFRFSDKAMEVLFGPPHFAECQAGYAYPCRIMPPPEVTRWNNAAEAYLNVECFSRR